MSTPTPPVALRTPSRNEVSFELKTLEGLTPNLSIRYCFFSSVDTVVYIYTLSLVTPAN